MGDLDTASGIASSTQGFIWSAGIGALVGLVVAAVILAGVRLGGRHSPLAVQVFRRTRIPLLLVLASLGMWMGFVLDQPDEPPVWFADVAHWMLILLIVCAGWLAFASLGLLKDASVLTDARTGRDVRRFRTQAQVLRRALQSLVVIMTIILVLLTFPQARTPMASLLASAGVLSVIAGLAAQSSLSNMFAGLQLAFTDAIRVGDTVVVSGEEQPSTVEEITLNYVVIRTWDERRVLIPSSEFATKQFQNWTRRAAKQLGVIELKLDWTAPVAQLRAEVERLLFATPLWDKRTWTVQVTEFNDSDIVLKVTVSAEDWGKMWDLRAYLRENLLAWVRDNAPWAIPASRRIVEGPEAVAEAWPTEAVLPEHLSEPQFTGPTGGGYMRAEQQKRIAADLRADQERKDAKDPLDTLKDAQNPSSLPGVSPVQPSTLSDLVQAAVSEPLPAAPDIQRIEDRLPGRADPYDRPVPDAFKDLKPGHMLFSGSPEAEERAKIYRGPGENVIRDREDRAQVRLEESNEPLPPEVAALRPKPSRP